MTFFGLFMFLLLVGLCLEIYGIINWLVSVATVTLIACLVIFIFSYISKANKIRDFVVVTGIFSIIGILIAEIAKFILI